MAASAASTSCPILRLNVGGVKYQTTVQTVTSVPDSMLEKMFSGSNELPPANVDEEGYFFVDRNGPAFAHVLEFLRSSTLPSWSLPLEEAEVLRHEAAYYGLNQLENWAAERACDRRITIKGLKSWSNMAINDGTGSNCAIDLANMDGSGLNLGGFSFHCSLWAPGVGFQNANLAHTRIDSGYSIFEDANFNGAILEGASIAGNFGGANLACASMRGARFCTRSYFDDLAGVDLRGVTFQGCFFSNSISFQGANLDGTRFSHCYVLVVFVGDLTQLQTRGELTKNVNLKALNFHQAIVRHNGQSSMLELKYQPLNAPMFHSSAHNSIRTPLYLFGASRVTGAINLDRALFDDDPRPDIGSTELVALTCQKG